MAFPQDVAERALVACGRHCCLCHKFCGTKIELHHIVAISEGGEDTIENCIPLCFDCHAEVEHYNLQHPRGRKFTPSELKAHRDGWYRRSLSSVSVPVDSCRVELDRETYQQLRKVLTNDGSIAFLRVNNYAGFAFPRARHDELSQFVRLCEYHPEFEFLDPDLEGLRADLAAKVDAFLWTVAKNTWTIEGVTDLSTVPPEWEYEQPKRFEEVVQDIHSLASSICEIYDSLVRLARRRLGTS